MKIRKEFTFAIIRHGPEETTRALVTVLTSLSFIEILPAIKQAVTRWMKETQEGKDAWEDSVEDFNIGDLSGYLSDPSLEERLKAEGIAQISIALDEPEEHPSWNYDTVLVNEEELDESEE